MKFTVNRAKWRCGTNGKNRKGEGSVKLLNYQGYMCCLGFCSLQLGLNPKDIIDIPFPYQINHPNLLGILNEVRFGDLMYTDLSAKAVQINDNLALTPEEREKRLSELFAEHGHEMVFEGEYESKSNS